MSVSNRIKRLRARLENRPEGQIPKLHVEYESGRIEPVMGYDILTREGVRRVTYDGRHQPSVDTAALYSVLFADGVEVVSQT